MNTPSGHGALADEITRSLGAMHNINLQRVDRITMAQGLEARTPFLDRDLIDFAQSIPASLKMKITNEETQETTEKWILRKACEDLLPAEVIWRTKAQFDEGSGTVDTLDQALSQLLAVTPPVDREAEGKLYERLLRDQYEDPDLILENAGMWTANRGRRLMTAVLANSRVFPLACGAAVAPPSLRLYSVEMELL